MTKDEDKVVILQSCYLVSFLRDFDNKIKINPTMSLSSFYSNWHKENKLSKEGIFPFHNNLGFYLQILFTLLILPKEVFYNSLPKTAMNELDKSEWGDFKIIKSVKNIDFQSFIRRIRNSLTHARFEEKDNKIRFFDKVNDSSTIDFETIVKAEELDKFIFRFARDIMSKY